MRSSLSWKLDGKHNEKDRNPTHLTGLEKDWIKIKKKKGGGGGGINKGTTEL